VYERKDKFYRKAKSEGYRSRAAYKLLELNNEFHFIKRGDRVVDLGAWPGGWVQVASQLVGETGKVLGVDLVALDSLPSKNVTLLQGDATSPTVQEQILIALGGPADVVLSDMAPKLSGIRETDEARTGELCHAALTGARAFLRPGGVLVLKVFANSEQKHLLTELRTYFVTVKTTRPDATRKGSAEAYAIAMGMKIRG
jgi:23S rRNA (uridine2552-2'-O)-methyltransferase